MMSSPALELATRALEAGDLRAAEKFSLEALKTSPREPAANLIQGICLMDTGRYRQSIPYIQNTLRFNPNDYVAMIRLPIALRGDGRYEEALRTAEEGFKLWPNDPDVISNLALCVLAVRDGRRAAELFRKAIASRPGEAALHHNLGTALELLAEDVLAADEYRKAIRLAPKTEESYASLILLLLNHGNAVQALEVCESAVQVAPDSANFRLLYSRVLREILEREQAEKQLLLAIELDPTKAAAGGFWMQEEGRFHEAEDYLKRALKLAPDDPFALLGLIGGKKISDPNDPTIKKLESLIEMGSLKPPSAASVRYALGKAYNDLKLYEKAMKHYEEANRLSYQINLGARGFNAKSNEKHFDRFIEVFSPSFIRKFKGLGSDSDLPIFVVGMIRSGTTLTEQILSSHPEIGAAGEQRFWLAEAPRAVDIDAGTLNSKLLVEFESTYLSILEQYSDKPKIVDKMPLNYFWVGLMHMAFPNAKFVHVRRSPIDNCLSIFFTALLKAPDFAYNKRNIIDGYREYERIMAHWRTVIPSNRLLEIDYEELVTNPEPNIRQMIDFLGLPWDDACLHHESNQRAVATPSVWQVRQPMYRTSIERWRNYEPWLGEFTELVTAP